MPFKKGDPNINRKGRPPVKESLSAILRDLAQYKPPDEEWIEEFKEWLPDKEPTFENIIGFRLLLKAASGDLPSIREYYNRTEGLPVQKLAIDQPQVINLTNVPIVEPCQLQRIEN